MTWHGSRCDERCGSRRPRRRPRPSTKPSTRPRCREQTSSGWASASSRNGQWAKATTARLAVVGAVDGGIEAELVELGDERLEAGRGVGAQAGVGPALVAADLGGVLAGRRRPAAASRSEHPGQQRERRRLEAERRSARAPASRGAAAGRRRTRVSVSHRRAGRPRASARGGAAPCWGAGRATRRCRRWPAGGASGPARGRWRSGCCRPAPSGRRGGASARPQVEFTRPDPGKITVVTRRAPPTPDDVMRPAPGRDRPGARRQHRRARHGAPAPTVGDPTATSTSSASSSPSAAARCGPRSRRTSRPASPRTRACASVHDRLGRDDAARSAAT